MKVVASDIAIIDISCGSLSAPIHVSLPVGDSIIMHRVYRWCLVTICGYETRVDLLLLGIVDFDVILGVDWLSPYDATLDCHVKTMTLAMPGLPRHKTDGWEGCEAYLVFLRDVSVDTPTVESLLVVRDFSDVFVADLPGMHPDRDINFGIDLVPGTYPISIPPYRMAPVELNELNEQLQKLLDKSFIRLSVSPWGALDLFEKKKDCTIRKCTDYR
ncbi:uncharacterized protein [Nicotiana sylvestris]|uniref:uncharacterized protein n=1 Tax=Nicotiana sylvestris TaxID=4096 RepID=UPI00388C41E6